MTTFNDLGLAEPVLKAVKSEGYDTPTPIQAQAIPVMIAGRDVLGIAQTGTGKTAAFVLPQLDRLARDRKKPRPKTAAVLILAPTRELASQIADSIRTYGRALKPSIAIVIGGAKPGPQVRALANGVDFIVATPGRLLDHLESGAVTLQDTRSVVLDEADQMLDLGFMPTIRKILGRVPSQRQTLLFSATMPKQIRSLANDFLSDPAEVSVAPVSKPITRIDQKVVFLDGRAKPRTLSTMLKDAAVERAVVFTRTKHGADRLCKQLDRDGVHAQPIHGNRSQGQRERTLSAFRSGKLSTLVATDIAARGIDIDDVTHVFNYDLPNVPEVYVHRIGRTARAGKTGHAVAFCTSAERSLLRDIERLTNIRIPVMEGAVNDNMPETADDRPSEKPHGEPRRETDGAPQAKKRKPRHRNRNKARADGDKPVAFGKPSEQNRRRRKRGKPAAENSPQEAARPRGGKKKHRKGNRPGAGGQESAGLNRMLEKASL